LLDRGADVNGRRRDGLTALHSAAYRGHLQVMRYLLQHGADVAIRGSDPTPDRPPPIWRSRRANGRPSRCWP
jgi:ankyrin repeat protein